MPDYLSALEDARCPTCGHSLARHVAHCGEEDSHVRRRTQAEAQRVLRWLHGVPEGTDLDAVLVASGSLPRPAHRPRRDPTAARVVKSYRIHPDTAARIEAEAKRSGESQGQIIDRLAADLSA